MVIDIDALANEIRRVDGSHSLGAGALAYSRACRGNCSVWGVLLY